MRDLDLKESSQPCINKEVAVVGGGWYGCHLALMLKKKGYVPTIFEKKSGFFQGISGTFGIRLHAGPHYPRSLATRKGCQEGFKKFCEVYPELINWHEYSIYALGREDALGYPSKIDIETFRAVCAEFRLRQEIDVNDTLDYKNTLAAFDIDEPSIVLGEPLRKTFQDYLQKAYITVVCNYSVKIIEKIDNQFLVSNGEDRRRFDYVVNTTSYQEMLPAFSRLPFNMEIVYQPCLALVYQDTHSSPSTRPFSFIVMDGWFPCVMPCDDGSIADPLHMYKKYILTHGMWTILGSYKTADQASQRLAAVNDPYIEDHVRPQCEKAIQNFWPAFKDRFIYMHWVGAVLAKIKTEVEFRGAVTFQDSHSGIIYVIPGKVSNVFDVETEVIALMGRQNILSDRSFWYTRNGVLDDACSEIKEKPVDSKRNTCELQTHEQFYNETRLPLGIFDVEPSILQNAESVTTRARPGVCN